jgi:hypothetical protein
MSTDLQKYIESLPIFTFLLAGDLLVIGRLVESQVGCVMVNALCSIETYSDEEAFRQMIVPAVPLSLEETSIIYRSHIVVQTPASTALKKSYCDTLLRIKVIGASQSTLSSSMSLETTHDILDSNPFKDRWNG